MQLLGLPNETLVHETIFGDILVSVDKHEELEPIVTLIWETPFNSGIKNPLATVLSIVYDPEIMDRVGQSKWLFELLAQPRPMKGHYLRGETDELLVAQSLAFDQIETIRKKQSHDRTSRSHPSALGGGHGLEGEAVHCPA